MTFQADVSSTQDSQPAELYTIATPVTTYYLTSYHIPITWSGHTYAPTTINRNSVETPIVGKSQDLTIDISLNHALAQDLLVGGIAWRDVTVQIDEYQQRSGTTGRRWNGSVSSVGSDGAQAQIVVSSTLAAKLQVRMPIAVAQRLCQHGLYDVGCTISRANLSFFVTSAVASISPDGLTVTVVFIGQPDNWAQYGDIVRAVDGERRSILSQVGNAITVDVPFRTLAIGNAMNVFAGCDHTVKTCRDKFSNVLNYGGHPDLPTINIASPTGRGVIGAV